MSTKIHFFLGDYYAMCWFYQALDGRFKFPMTDALFTFDFTLDTFSGVNIIVDYFCTDANGELALIVKGLISKKKKSILANT